MNSREKRIYLRLCSKSEQQRAVIEKLEHYDKRRYDSLTEYIVQAILAFNEPVSIGEDRLRQILREELGGDSRTITTLETEKQEKHDLWEETNLRQEKKEEEEKREMLSEAQEAQETQQENEAAPDMDATTIAFMKEMGIM